MKCNFQIYKWVLILLMFIYSLQIHAEVHPVLFKDDTALYPKVYFGMGIDEFKLKLGSNIFECKDAPNKKIMDIGCKMSFRFGGSGISEAAAIFKDNTLIAVVARVNSDFYGSVISNLSSIYKDQPQSENRDEKKGLFSNKISNEYSIWSYPDYLMLVSKFEIPKYVENGTNFLLAVETTNDNFINSMQIESKKKSNINIRPKVANIDIAKLHLSNESPINTGEKKIEAVVVSHDPKSIQNNNNSINSAVTPQSTTQSINLKTTITERSLLASDMSLGAKKEQLKEKVAFCSIDDKFLTEFRKNFPKYIVDEYCVGSNLVKDIQADTLFFLKKGYVRLVIHHANSSEFRKLSLLYKETFGNEPKNKLTYKGSKSVSCFFDEGLNDYIEFCRYGVGGFALATENLDELNSGIQNRAKLIDNVNRMPRIATYSVNKSDDSKSNNLPETANNDQSSDALTEKLTYVNIPIKSEIDSKLFQGKKPLERPSNSSAVSNSTSEFEAAVKFKGKQFSQKVKQGFLAEPIEYTYFLRSSLIKKTGKIYHQLYISTKFMDRFRWEKFHATDAEANTLETVDIDFKREVAGGMLLSAQQDIAISFSEETLYKCLEKPYKIKLDWQYGGYNSRYESVVFEIPPEYIHSQLYEIEQYKQSHKQNLKE